VDVPVKDKDDDVVVFVFGLGVFIVEYVLLVC